jgi:hypothetical protein
MMNGEGILKELNQFTDELETHFAKYPSLEDTAARDVICEVLQSVFLSGKQDVKIPIFFGVFHPGANLSIHKVLKRFATSNGLTLFVASHDEEERVAILKEMFEKDQIVSRSGNPLTEILGEWV